MVRALSKAQVRVGVAAWFVGAVAPGCNLAKPIGLDVPQSRQQLTPPPNNTAAARPGLDALVPEGSSLVKATYKTTAGIPMRLCSGDIELKVNANIIKANSTKVFEFPRASMDCGLLGKLDLTSLLAGFSTAANPQMDVKDDVIHVKRLGNGWYDPPRPFMPSFIAASRENLRRLKYSQDIILNDDAKKVSDRGTVVIRTIDYPTTYRPPGMKRTFKKVLYFETVITGFRSNIDKPMHMLFDYLRFRVSLDPIAILSVELSGSAKALVDSAKTKPELQNSTMGQLMGIIPDPNAAGASDTAKLMGGFADLMMQVIQVKLDMTLVSQEGLKDSDDADEDDEIFTKNQGDE